MKPARRLALAAAALALVAAMYAAVDAGWIPWATSEEDWPWYVTVVELPGHPDGAATVYSVNESTLLRHPLIWNLTQEARREDSGFASQEVSEAQAMRVIGDFARGVGAEVSGFPIVRFEHDGRFYQASAAQPQP